MTETSIRIGVANCEDTEPVELSQKEHEELITFGHIELKLMCYRGYSGGVKDYEDEGEEGVRLVLRKDGRLCCLEDEGGSACTGNLGREFISPRSSPALTEPKGNITIISQQPTESIFSKERFSNIDQQIELRGRRKR